ncbi:MAG TPA: tetratricopeptide repeat protein [Thermoanaerobaculia bacterium]|jgi:TolB-like protein/Tfp pilus assembly protein PilF|nr:tetratricopeptide repeat protein [Thermoanaerobaculia bacterium]
MRVLFGDCTFDSEARTLVRGDENVRLSGKAFQLLELLLAARPNPMSKSDLFARLWPDTFVSEANLASLVKEIRAAIGDDARAPRFVRTVHRFGYAFSAPVTETPERSGIESIAVLPFANRSGNADLDYLADGLAESLINTLASIEGLRVAPRASSFRYRDANLGIVRRELNVRAALTGRVRVVADAVNLQVELIDLAKDAQLWGRQFQAPIRGIFTLEEELSRDVVTALRLRVTGETDRRLRKRYTESASAYQLYLKGRHHWNRRTAEGIERAIFFFESAIGADGAYAPAYSGLADCYIALASRDLYPSLQLMPKAETAARRALELDAELAEAHASMGAIHEVFHWKWERAQEEYLTALRLNPGYVTARLWYALALAHRGRIADALAQMSVAAESDPLSFMVNANTAVVHYLGRAYDEAEELCHRALEINPHHEPAHFTLGLAHQQRGRFDNARAELEKALGISRGEPHVVAALGALERSRARLDALAELSLTRDVSPVHFATVHVALGENDQALEWLERALEARSGWLVYLATEPRFDALRGDERFSVILSRVDGEGSPPDGARLVQPEVVLRRLRGSG